MPLRPLMTDASIMIRGLENSRSIRDNDRITANFFIDFLDKKHFFPFVIVNIIWKASLLWILSLYYHSLYL